MSALDRYHQIVIHALVKDGWTITHNPLRLEYGNRAVLVDIAAERILGAEKGTRKIAVEIKTFLGPSVVADLQQAVGQFVMYEDILARLAPERELYLAVPDEALQTIFTEALGDLMLQKHIRRVFGFSIQQEEIVKWIP